MHHLYAAFSKEDLLTFLNASVLLRNASGFFIRILQRSVRNEMHLWMISESIWSLREKIIVIIIVVKILMSTSCTISPLILTLRALFSCRRNTSAGPDTVLMQFPQVYFILHFWPFGNFRAPNGHTHEGRGRTEVVFMQIRQRSTI